MSNQMVSFSFYARTASTAFAIKQGMNQQY